MSTTKWLFEFRKYQKVIACHIWRIRYLLDHIYKRFWSKSRSQGWICEMVHYHFEWGSFSTTSRPSLNAQILYIIEFPKAFSDICNASEQEIPFATQNFKQSLSSICLSIVKLADSTLGKLTYLAADTKLVDSSRSNSASK